MDTNAVTDPKEDAFWQSLPSHDDATLGVLADWYAEQGRCGEEQAVRLLREGTYAPHRCVNVGYRLSWDWWRLNSSARVPSSKISDAVFNRLTGYSRRGVRYVEYDSYRQAARAFVAAWAAAYPGVAGE